MALQSQNKMWTRGKTLEVNFIAFAKQSCGLEGSYSYISACCDTLRRQQNPEQKWIASSALRSINCSFQFVICKLAGSAHHPFVQIVDSSNYWGSPHVTHYQLYFESVSNAFFLILFFLFRHDFHVDVLCSHHWNCVGADYTGPLSCSYEDEPFPSHGTS